MPQLLKDIFFDNVILVIFHIKHVSRRAIYLINVISIYKQTVYLENTTIDLVYFIYSKGRRNEIRKLQIFTFKYSSKTGIVTKNVLLYFDLL